MEWLNVATLRFGDKKFPRGTTGVENLMMENSGGTNENVGGGGLCISSIKKLGSSQNHSVDEIVWLVILRGANSCQGIFGFNRGWSYVVKSRVKI